jgi:hypothetical protein
LFDAYGGKRTVLTHLRKCRSNWLGTCLLLLIPSWLDASPIQLNSLADFSAAPTLINFDGLPDGTVVNNLFAAQGVTFARDDGQAVPVIDWTSLGRTTTSPTNVIGTISTSAAHYVFDLNVLFGSPILQVGAFFGNDQGVGYTQTTLEVFDIANNSLGSVVVNTNDNTSVDQFIGLSSTAPFARARFSNNGTFLAVVLDDLQFVSRVPEPASAWLLITGGLALGAFRVRKR